MAEVISQLLRVLVRIGPIEVLQRPRDHLVHQFPLPRREFSADHLANEDMPKISETALTAGLVRAAKPKPSRYEIRDSVQRGLILRVYPSGRKMFVIQLERGRRRTIEDATLITVTNARNKARDFLTAHGNGETPESRRQKKATLNAYLSGQYMDWVSKQNRFGARDTRRLMSALGKLGNKKLNQISQLAIEKWKRKRVVAPATVNRELAHLKAALNRAVEWGVILANPATKVRRLQDKAGKRVRWLTDSEHKSLDAALCERNDYLPFMVRLTLQTGLRRGEVFQLQWEDVNFQTLLLTVHARNAKSNRDRHIPMNDAVFAVLRDWRMRSGRREGLVFPNPSTGLPLRDIKTAWRTLMKKAEIKDFRFHDIRHDFASRLVLAGTDLYTVKELLGHSSITITERYAHLSDDTLRQAVENLK